MKKVLVFLCLSFLFLILIVDSDKTKRDINEEIIIRECNTTNLLNSSHCLNDFIKEIFVYNLTKESLEPLSFSEILIRGGDCETYSRWYCKMSEMYGFECKMIIISINETIDHTFAVTFDDSGYCKLDMEDIDCFEYEI